MRRGVTPRLLETLTAACQSTPTYLDKFYALQPGGAIGAKRLIVVLPAELRARCDLDWCDELGSLATLVWRGEAADEELAAYECAWQPSASPLPLGERGR